MKATNKEPIYFPGLNGIRAIAALLVVVSHISLSISQLGFMDYKGIDMAGYGVTMFFVLSGYLITYLLLTEHERNHQISYRKFYLRRILRIWPLYYLALGVALIFMFLTHTEMNNGALWLSILLMANVPFAYGVSLPFIGQIWSVGVEEQFYLFWPWLFKKRNHLLAIMVSIILIYMLLRLFLRISENGPIYTLLGVTRFHCMAIGGIGALAFYEKWNLLKYIYNPILQLVCWLILIVSLYKPFHTYSIVDGELYALIFLVIILNVSTNPKAIIKLETKLANWLGKISYGIYIYHMFALYIVFELLKGRVANNYGNMGFVYLCVIGLTLLFAHLSFRHFESYFLDMKRRFSIVESRIKPIN